MTRPRIDPAIGLRIIDLKKRVVANFTSGNWRELGMLTGFSADIENHSRLLRSLSFNDDDYEDCALAVLQGIVEDDARALPTIEEYLDRTFPGESTFISAKPAERKITFAPNVFQVPDGYVESDLVALMMPFTMEFNTVHKAVSDACTSLHLRCQRVDDIWEDSTIVQDIFNLIFRASVVVVDFSGRNPNVMYETGIAHTLGKHVVPISRSMEDVPFDLRHHRVQPYLPNDEGIAKLRQALKKKLAQFAPRPPVQTPPIKPKLNLNDDDIPF